MLALMQLASFYGNSAHVFTITEFFPPLISIGFQNSWIASLGFSLKICAVFSWRLFKIQMIAVCAKEVD